ncbi:MAG: polysaccharide biosynthesis/export family protein, partial [Planctomycetales bacterium]|nr:polysaccharide biosynthesis/export family protein [Planctomycetales bacterium]
MRLACATLLLMSMGCAAITSPVANGVPVHMLPDELLADSKEDLVQIPPTWLKAGKPKNYRLDTGDILAVYVYDVLPKGTQVLPVNFPDSSSIPPSWGVPIPVRENGTVTLPLIGSIEVRGLTVDEAE